jgi:hypothetical protein
VPTYKHTGTVSHFNRLYRLQDVEKSLSEKFNVVVLSHDLETALDEVSALQNVPMASVPRQAYLMGADVVVTDTSGISFECAAVNKPVVFLVHPDEPAYLLDQTMNTGEALDFGPAVLLDALPDAVALLAAMPDKFAAQRKKWAERIFGPVDGCATERTADAIVKFAYEFGLRRYASGYSSNRPRALLGDFVELKMQFFAIGEGVRFDGRMMSLETDGGIPAPLFYGPYLNLAGGKYCISVDFQEDIGADMLFEVYVDRGSRRLLSVKFVSQLKGQFVVEVPNDATEKSFEMTVGAFDRSACKLKINQFSLSAFHYH